MKLDVLLSSVIVVVTDEEFCSVELDDSDKVSVLILSEVYSCVGAVVMVVVVVVLVVVLVVVVLGEEEEEELLEIDEVLDGVAIVVLVEADSHDENEETARTSHTNTVF